jgi:hypothetical protein
MKLGFVWKIPFFAVVTCICMALLAAEVVAFYELAHHDCTGLEDNCSVCQRAKAAADFLDTLRLVCLFPFFSLFVLFLPEIFQLLKEYSLIPSSLITLKVRSDT